MSDHAKLLARLRSAVPAVMGFHEEADGTLRVGVAGVGLTFDNLAAMSALLKTTRIDVAAEHDGGCESCGYGECETVVLTIRGASLPGDCRL